MTKQAPTPITGDTAQGAPAERIAPADLAYRQKLEREANEAAALARSTVYAFQRYHNHLMEAYALTPADEVDLETGIIHRGIHAPPAPMAATAD